MLTLLRLSGWQIANAVRHALRDPRRWVPALLVGVFFLFQMRSLLISGVPLPPEFVTTLRAHLGTVRACVFLVLCLTALSYINQGLTGGVLSFSPPDTAFLFPSPVGRKAILLAKLPSALGPMLLTLAGEAWAFRAFVWLPLGGETGAHAAGWRAAAAAALCVGGWLNIAVAIELIFGIGAYARWQKILNGGVFLLVGLIAFLGWKHGLTGLAAITASGPLTWLFGPCYAAAQVVMAPLVGASAALWTWPFLAAWYGLTLALLFARRDNYYEAAARGTALLQKRRAAQRAGRMFGTGADKGGQTRTTGKPYSLPPFGTGALALLWAHLTAAAKRPLPNFALPLAGGMVAAAACVWAAHAAAPGAPGIDPDDALSVSQLVRMIVGVYLYAFVFTVGLSHYQRSLLRQTLMRPLPLPAWQVVAGETGARAALGSLPAWTLALGLAVLHPKGWALLMLPLIVTLPVFICCLNLILMRVALWYPNTADRVQMFTASLVQFLLLGPLLLLLSGLQSFPDVLASHKVISPAAAAWLSPLCLLVGCVASAGMLLRWDVASYARFEPTEGTKRRATSRARTVSNLQAMIKKRVRTILVTVIVLLAVLFAGARVEKNLHKPPVPPRTVAARLGDMQVSVSESGTVQPVDKVDVKSKVGGRLLSVPIMEGQRVTQGQLIATVDRSQIDPQIAGLRAQLAQAQARLQQSIAAYNLQVAQSRMAVAQARAGLRTSQTHLGVVAAPARAQDLSQQQQAVTRARIALDDAQRTRTRRLALLAKGFVSQSDADATQVAVDTAASTLASAQQQLALLQAGARPVDVTDARAQVESARVAVQTAQANQGQNAVALSAIAQSKAAIAQTQNDLAQLEVKLGDTRIIAPANGIVLKRYRQVGEIVQDATTGFSDTQSLVATLGSKLEVRVGINEVDIPKVRVGLPVVLHVDALPNVSFAGHVTEIAPASSNAFADASAGGSSASSGIAKFLVKVGLDKDDTRLRPGMTTDVQIISARHAHVVLAPLEAISGTGKTVQVSVLSARSVKQPRTLTLGLRNDTDVEVTHGLKPGDKVLIPPIDATGRRKISINGG